MNNNAPRMAFLGASLCAIAAGCTSHVVPLQTAAHRDAVLCDQRVQQEYHVGGYYLHIVRQWGVEPATPDTAPAWASAVDIVLIFGQVALSVIGGGVISQPLTISGFFSQDIDLNNPQIAFTECMAQHGHTEPPTTKGGTP